MRSLFAKIFVTFFLTVVLLGVLLEVTAIRTEMRRVDEVFRPFAERIAPQVAEDYEQRGAEALAADLRRLPVPAALLDERAQPLSAIPEPIRVELPAVRGLLDDASEPLSRFVAWRNVAFVPVSATSGRRYLFAFVIPHERWMALLNTLDQYPAIRLSLVGCVAGVICFLLARHITRPLVDLRATAARMADGRLDARAGPAVVRRHDEIGALGRDFDAMAGRLDALVASQQRLFADVSHELRSPLSRLTVAAGLVRQHVADVPADRRALVTADLDRIEREAARLDALIGQSLTLARIESGVEVSRRESFDLTSLVQDVVADGDYEARATGRRVVMHDAEPCSIVCIADLVRSAVENLVRNAIRYTAPDTTVEVSLRRIERDRSPWASLRVRDHGPGIADDVDEMFKPFRRGEPPAAQRAEGAGLGLAIVSRVVETHGGRVHAENAPGGGLEIEIVLPRSDRA